MVRMVIFDDGLGELGPMDDLRAAFEIRTGVLTTAQRLLAARREPLGACWVPPRLTALVAQRSPAPVNRLPDEPLLLCVSGRWALPAAEAALEPGQALCEERSGHVVAALLEHRDAESFLATAELPMGVECRLLAGPILYRYAWEIIARASEAIRFDLSATRLVEVQVPPETAIVGDGPVEVHGTARVYPNVIFDAGCGPIRVDERAVVRPGAVLCGPCSIGPDCTVVDGALIKPNTVLGPVCKVGGEVGATIFQGRSNKSHDGHLGDSWVGEWVNVGAGTTNSNLLNTYGEILMRLEPQGPMHRTGLQFLGAVIGDHAKLAIGTRIGTGAVIGTGAMVATTHPVYGTVRRFAWLTDRGEQVFRFARFLETARAMMSRRRESPGDACVEALRLLHEAHRGARG
jgi:UDP-N-acetylglucosamine diphosphorylase/glucosamine-1-phosphate N-acetyltransferase